MLIWFQFSAIKFSLTQMTHNKTEQNDYSESPFQWKKSEISKPLAWLRTTICKPVLLMFEIKLKKKKKNLFWSTLMWPPIQGMGATFFFEHLIDVFCYLLSFCYLLAEWLAVNTRMRTD